MTDNQQYQKLLTEFIQAQMVILGSPIGLDIAQSINNLKIDETGKVLSLSSNPQQTLNELASAYNEVSPHTTNNTVHVLLEKYPDIQKPVL